jgi:hypothetical protein
MQTISQTIIETIAAKVCIQVTFTDFPVLKDSEISVKHVKIQRRLYFEQD